MPGAACPFCGCREFYVKDPDDAFEVHAFEIRDEEIVFHDLEEDGNAPEVQDQTETYCESCAWHGKFSELKEKGDSS